MDLDIQDTVCVGVQHGANMAVGCDGCCHAGVRRAQHRPSWLDCPHPRALQVLTQGPRLAEPSQIADVYQDAGSRSELCAWPDCLDDFFSKNIFVADIGREALPRQYEMLLAG